MSTTEGRKPGTGRLVDPGERAFAIAQVGSDGAPGGEAKLRIEGRLTFADAAQLWAELGRFERAAAAGETLNLDMSRVEWLDGGDATLGKLRRRRAEGTLDQLGNATIGILIEIQLVLAFFGQTVTSGLGAIRAPRTVNWRELAPTMERNGADAVPIVVLINFLVGLGMAYQASRQLELFGANILVADMIGITVTRELGPLMTAIVLCGRSGAAFAAELGSTRVNEEIDALRTMGFGPMRFLVVPRALAMILVLPLLTLLADGAGLLGGLLVGTVNLGILGLTLLPRYFTPEYALETLAAPQALADLRLRLGRVTAWSHLRERMVVRSSDQEIRYYDDRRWTERPEIYLRRALSGELFQERGLVHVISGPAPTLEVELASFEEIQSASDHRARLVAHLVLYDERVGRLEETVTVEAPVRAAPEPDRGRAVAEALSLALRTGVAQIADHVVAKLSAMAAAERAPPSGRRRAAVARAQRGLASRAESGDRRASSPSRVPDGIRFSTRATP